MAYLVRLQPRATRPPLSLLYIRAHDSATAADWFNGMVNSISSLETMPNRCVPLSGRPGLRQLLYGNKPHIYRIFFRADVTKKVVDILHIRHGARDAIAPSAL